MQKKTVKDVEKLLKPLYKDGKPFIISEKDYMWVKEVIPPNGYGIVRFMFEDVYFDTLKTKTKEKKLQCLLCKKADGIVKFYTITNDMQRLKAYHSKCFRKITHENAL
jgi:hypothetical protein